MRLPEDYRHQNDAANLRFEPRGESRLHERAKEKFLGESNFESQPGEAERKTQQQLMSGEFSPPNRRRCSAEKVLECKQRGADKNERQMIANDCTQTLELNSEIAESISENKAKDPQWNEHEHDQLFCQR